MLLAIKYKPIKLQKVEACIETIFLALIWLAYFASINVNWIENWVAISFLPDSVAPHAALAFPIIFFTNVFWLIPKYFNKKKWYLYLIISLGLLSLYEVIRVLIFSVYLTTNTSFTEIFNSELKGENSLIFGNLYFIMTTNAVFLSFAYRFARDWVINQSVINKLQTENTHLRISLSTEEKSKTYREFFTVKKRNNKSLLQIDAIVYFKAQGDFVLVIDYDEKKHIINDSLKNINNQIDPKRFFQINRSEIVNIGFIEKFNPYIKNRVEIALKNSNQLLYTSNSRTPKFRAWISKNQ